MKGLGAVYEQYINCTACGLSETRNSMVFGAGPEDAKIMFIGLAPGAKEDEKGLPFIGDAGSFMKKVLLKKAGIKMDDFFITNIVCCRPFILNERQKRKDRDPTKAEIGACIPRLFETIYTIDPILIVTLGALASDTLARTKGKGFAITKKRGEIIPGNEIIIPGKTMELRYPMLPILHPSYLLRNPDIGVGGWIEKTVDDFIRVRENHELYGGVNV